MLDDRSCYVLLLLVVLNSLLDFESELCCGLLTEVGEGLKVHVIEGFDVEDVEDHLQLLRVEVELVLDSQTLVVSHDEPH